MKLTKLSAVPKACAREKTVMGIAIIFLVLIITLMLSRIFSEAIMFIVTNII